MANGTARNDGHVWDYSKPGQIQARLMRFGIDSAALHSKHCSWLDGHVVPVLAAGGSISIHATASRSGSAAHNLALSKRRASAVLAYLRRKVPRHVSYRVELVESVGEGSAEMLGYKDGTEDPYFRAVSVLARRRPTPPPRSTSKP
jgi:outer membrane protein OmpA-like peptidoglycan-associated protein